MDLGTAFRPSERPACRMPRGLPQDQSWLKERRWCYQLRGVRRTDPSCTTRRPTAHHKARTTECCCIRQRPAISARLLPRRQEDSYAKLPPSALIEGGCSRPRPSTPSSKRRYPISISPTVASSPEISCWAWKEAGRRDTGADGLSDAESAVGSVRARSIFSILCSAADLDVDDRPDTDGPAIEV